MRAAQTEDIRLSRRTLSGGGDGHGDGNGIGNGEGMRLTSCS